MNSSFFFIAKTALPGAGRYGNTVEVTDDDDVGKDLARFGREGGVVGVALGEVREDQPAGPGVGRQAAAWAAVRCP